MVKNKISHSGLKYRLNNNRNIGNTLCTSLTILSSLIAVLPLVLVLGYVIINGASKINFSLFTELPPPPGLDGGGIGNAILGTIIVTSIASFIAIPVGVGGGIYLAEYSANGPFAKFIRFGTNVLSGVPSIITGVFIYSIIVSTRLILGSSYSAIAGGTGTVLSISRAAGETAPLIFTSLFSFYWPEGSDVLINPIATLSVLIYNFSTSPLEVQQQLALAASFILVMFILALNILSRWLGRLALK